ncbi:MAG: GNAT family N-acetyltransferase [Clostridiales bacterium]|jgi:RimJ/RimL family protein N-acetyltransferase/ubiquinone/menaquinone biosynthesis C-methylase UbiE|nr:GNAT family N-acetyltransferase [Clostridiales bacterium]
MECVKIETSRLILRPFTESDAAAVKCFAESEFETEADALKWIHWINEMPGKRPDTNRLLIMFAIELKQTSECIGRAYIHSKIELNGEVEIGYGISNKRRNMGYATEAAKAAVWFAFERAGQDALSAIVKPENAASRRVIEKLGFVSGGVRTVLDDDGKYFDFDYFRLYHTDCLPSPEWDVHSLYKPELMGAFFDIRSNGYNDKMLSGGGVEDYIKLGACFPKTDRSLNILDVGCGTGIELDYIWAQATNAHIACVDVSRGMLDLLLKNHSGSHDRITIVEASYIDWTYPENVYDIVVSNMTMHHLWPDEKIEVYRKIHSALKPDGRYVEGDFVVDAIAAKQYQRRYEIITANLTGKAEPGKYHIDIPCTIETQIELLRDAGFSSVEVLRDNINHGNGAILQARK